MSDSYDDYEAKMQLAEHAWEEHVDEMVKTEHDKQIEIAQAYERGWNAALAQQEPVAWPADMLERIDAAIQRITSGQGCMRVPPDKTDPDLVLADIRKLIKSSQPASKPWVGLTDEEIQDLSYLSQKIDASNSEWFDRWGFARAIEAKLREKNI